VTTSATIRLVALIYIWPAKRQNQTKKFALRCFTSYIENSNEHINKLPFLGNCKRSSALSRGPTLHTQTPQTLTSRDIFSRGSGRQPLKHTPPPGKIDRRMSLKLYRILRHQCQKAVFAIYSRRAECQDGPHDGVSAS